MKHTMSEQQYKEFCEELGQMVVDRAEEIFEECGVKDDFCIQSMGSRGGIFGGTNRLYWNPKDGFTFSGRHCTSNFIEKFKKNYIEGEPKEQTYYFYFLDGKKYSGPGRSVEDAFSRLGWGAGALRAVDVYTLDDIYVWNPETKKWVNPEIEKLNNRKIPRMDKSVFTHR